MESPLPPKCGGVNGAAIIYYGNIIKDSAVGPLSSVLFFPCINHYIYYLSSCMGGYEKGQMKAEATDFSEEIGPISNSLSLPNTREQRLFLWKIVSCKIKVQIIGEKMTFTSRHLVDVWEILPAFPLIFLPFFFSSMDLLACRFWAKGAGAFVSC